jgi:CNT family concentrative nucleoside transporter
MKKILFIAISLIFFGSSFGQSIEKKWQFSSIEKETGETLFSINKEKDFFNLKDGAFQYELEGKDNLKASGDYIFQNNLLVLFYNQPNDTIRRYRVSQITDSTLVFSENNILYKFDVASIPIAVAPPIIEETTDIVPVEGFSLKSLLRGILGMFSLIFIAFLFSSNRKAINWKTVGIGLAFQLIIAIGVLKVPFIKSIFEGIGKVFISILDFTRAGSKFSFLHFKYYLPLYSFLL